MVHLKLVEVFGISTQDLFIEYLSMDASLKGEIELDVEDIIKLEVA